MFDEVSAVPPNPPRTGVLPGMRLRSAVPRSTLILLLAFVLFFAVFPLSIMSTDPKAKLGIFPSSTTQGRVLSVTDVSGWRGSAARRVVYAFSAESGNEFRGAGGGKDCLEPWTDISHGSTRSCFWLQGRPQLRRVA
jgi:hypothetical protein